MKKISKEEVARIKRLVKLKKTFIGVGLFVYISIVLLSAAWCVENNLSGPSFSMCFGTLGLGIGLAYAIWTIMDSDDLKKAELIKKYEEAKVHKEALETYNKLNKVFS